MKTTRYTLFSQPITRRTYTWLLFLCPWAALFLLLASRNTTRAASTPASTGNPA